MVTVIDASGVVLGRLGSVVAKRLLDGDEVIVVNAEKAVITGKKQYLKAEYKQKREVGTYRKGPFFPRMPDRIVKRTIRGMLPYQTPHGRAAYKRLKCYIGVPEEFEGKNMEKIADARKTPLSYMTVEELSKSLGAD
ncbi:MAG: 50S ribosomal protein L13 [Thermoplasmata archaeon]|nr:MAG: 50S ribosomal protein L13 [Thermoplasmata archaeon]MCD6467862.1 50S ribosomal protein L13 [Thermoplasmata archaeon]RLF27177.1 MAG: 50S ribosomal protein L13 [Thermoplasmata archaeon]